MTQDYSELAATLASIEIPGNAGPAASHDQAGELVQTASRVLRGLMRQLGEIMERSPCRIDLTIARDDLPVGQLTLVSK